MIYPNIFPSLQSNHAERQVFQALEKLGDGFYGKILTCIHTNVLAWVNLVLDRADGLVCKNLIPHFKSFEYDFSILMLKILTNPTIPLRRKILAAHC